MWRNDGIKSPHFQGMALDIAFITKKGITVNFKNDTVDLAKQSPEAMKLRDEVFNSLWSDKKVTQYLDPWTINLSRNEEDQKSNKWENILNDKWFGADLFRDSNNKTSILNDLELLDNEMRQLQHRHHLHITISYY
jgi:hypothetical protein